MFWFYNFREARGVGGSPKDDVDIFSERPDPSALKVCSLNLLHSFLVLV